MEQIKKAIVYFLSWRLALGLVVWAGITWLPFKPTYPYANEWLPFLGPRLLTTWAGFDGVHYVTIALRGYVGTGLIQAFFPLYPMLMSTFSKILNPVLAGVTISTISFFIGWLMLGKLWLMDETKILVSKSLWLILLFPTAFFFGAVYNEGLFFLLTVLTCYFARKQQWWLAGFVGALAAATRLIGVYLVFYLLIEYFMYAKQKMGFRVIALFIPMAGLIAYMMYLKLVFNDPLLFYHVQTSFGASREIGKIVLPPQVFWRYLKMLTTVPLSNPIYYTSLMEFITALGGFWLLIVGWYKTRKSDWWFTALAFVTPMLTGNFSSLPRYVLPLFPFFLILAKIIKGRWIYLYYLAFGILQVVNLLIFTQGLWVA